LPHISLGDVVREHVNRQTELGKEIVVHWGNIWKPLPDGLAVRVARETLAGHTSWILDGFPRNVAQAETTADFIGDSDLVIHLKVSDEESCKRVTARARSAEAEAVWRIRMAVEHERLPELVAHMNSCFRLVEVDASPSEEIVNASLLKIVGE